MTQPYYDPYSRIERAMVARLDAGMRGMVREVVSYGGQLDDDLTLIVQALPAVWVTFGGIQETQALSTSHKKWKVRGRFAVMVGQKNARSEVANRQGSGRPQEVGTNALVWAVRRLLTDQDLVDQDANLKIDPLSPGRVRPIFNTTVERQTLSVFAAEFDTSWIEYSLPNGRLPVPAATSDEPGVPVDVDANGVSTSYDQLFALYPAVQTAAPLPWLDGVDLSVYRTPLAEGQTPSVTDQVNFNNKDQV